MNPELWDLRSEQSFRECAVGWDFDVLGLMSFVLFVWRLIVTAVVEPPAWA